MANKIFYKIYQKVIDISNLDFASKKEVINEVRILTVLENPFMIQFKEAFLEN
jgi:hypothetical protein